VIDPTKNNSYARRSRSFRTTSRRPITQSQCTYRFRYEQHGRSVFHVSFGSPTATCSTRPLVVNRRRAVRCSYFFSKNGPRSATRARPKGGRPFLPPTRAESVGFRRSLSCFRAGFVCTMSRVDNARAPALTGRGGRGGKVVFSFTVRCLVHRRQHRRNESATCERIQKQRPSRPSSPIFKEVARARARVNVPARFVSPQ